MKFRFDRHDGLVIVLVELTGPDGSGYFRFALDTGASQTLVNSANLVALGYDPAATTNRLEMTTGSGVEYVSEVCIQELIALGHRHTGLTVIAHTLPPSIEVDGLLGLDFFRDLKLNIDFRKGHITVS